MLDVFGNEVKLIVIEPDGVLTDGKIMVDELGHILWRVFNSKDLDALNELKRYFKVAFMSTNNQIFYNFFRSRNDPFYWAKNEHDKFETLGNIMRRYSCTPDQTMYVGAKVSDRKCLQTIPCSVVPVDVSDYLKQFAMFRTESAGGDGVLSDLLDTLQDRIKNIDN